MHNVHKVMVPLCPHYTGNMFNFLSHYNRTGDCTVPSYNQKKFLSQNACQLMEEMRELVFWKGVWETEFYPIGGVACDVAERYSRADTFHPTNPGALERVMPGVKMNPNFVRKSEVLPQCASS